MILPLDWGVMKEKNKKGRGKKKSEERAPEVFFK